MTSHRSELFMSVSLCWQWGGHLHWLPASCPCVGAQRRACLCCSRLQDWLLLTSDSGWPGTGKTVCNGSMWSFKSDVGHRCYDVVYFPRQKSTKIKKGSKGDTSVLQPTLMAAVPVCQDPSLSTILIQSNVWETLTFTVSLAESIWVSNNAVWSHLAAGLISLCRIAITESSRPQSAASVA